MKGSPDPDPDLTSPPATWAGGLDLDDLDRKVARREERWRGHGIAWEVIRWPVTDKPAASLGLTVGSREGELILWVSGEAEMITFAGPDEEPVQEHYELSGVFALRGCLNDLEALLVLPEPTP